MNDKISPISPLKWSVKFFPIKTIVLKIFNKIYVVALFLKKQMQKTACHYLLKYWSYWHEICIMWLVFVKFWTKFILMDYSPWALWWQNSCICWNISMDYSDTSKDNDTQFSAFVSSKTELQHIFYWKFLRQ